MTDHTTSLFDQAVQHHRDGQLEPAVDLYRRWLVQSPLDVAACNNLGTALKGLGRLDEAVETYQRACEIDPDSASAAYNLGTAFQGQRRVTEAIEAYQRALVLRPDYPEASYNLGLLLKANGLAGEALTRFALVVTSAAWGVRARHHIAEIHLQAERCDEALAEIARALAMEPSRTETWLLKARIEVACRDVAAATHSLHQAVQTCSGNVAVLHAVAHQFKEWGALDEAEGVLRRILSIKSDDGDALLRLATILRQKGQADAALAMYEQILAESPQSYDALVNAGRVCSVLHRYDAAEGFLQRAIAVNPKGGKAYTLLASSLVAAGDVERADDLLAKAYEVEPLAETRVQRALLLPVIPSSLTEMRWWRRKHEEAIDALLTEGLKLDDPRRQITSTTFVAAYHGENDRDLQVKLAAFYEQACPDLTWEAPHCRQPLVTKGRRLRVGIVSHFFQHNHIISISTAGLIRNLDRSQFEVVVFHVDPVANTDETVMLAADAVVRLNGALSLMRDDIAAHQLDILLYPDIGMSSATYFLGFSRLAWVQCVQGGHPVTTGIKNIDYFLSTVDLEPEGAEGHYSERLIRFSEFPTRFPRPSVGNLRFCRQEFGFSEDWHIYASPFTLFKFHPEFDEVLGRILRADSQGRLVMVEGLGSAWRQRLMGRFASVFPDVVDRVVWLDRLPYEQFVQLIGAVDLILDPFHFGGGTTNFVAFAAGVPVVTLPGAFNRERQTLAFYRQMGMDTLVATDPDDYVAKALRVAQDPSWRSSLSQTILERCDALFDSVRAVTQVQEFFLQAVAAAAR